MSDLREILINLWTYYHCLITLHLLNATSTVLRYFILHLKAATSLCKLLSLQILKWMFIPTTGVD